MWKDLCYVFAYSKQKLSGISNHQFKDWIHVFLQRYLNLSNICFPYNKKLWKKFHLFDLLWFYICMKSIVMHVSSHLTLNYRLTLDIHQLQYLFNYVLERKIKQTSFFNWNVFAFLWKFYCQDFWSIGQNDEYVCKASIDESFIILKM